MDLEKLAEFDIPPSIEYEGRRNYRIKLLGDLTNGKYEPEEIRDLLQKNYPDSQVINREILNEYLKYNSEMVNLFVQLIQMPSLRPEDMENYNILMKALVGIEFANKIQLNPNNQIKSEVERFEIEPEQCLQDYLEIFRSVVFLAHEEGEKNLKFKIGKEIGLFIKLIEAQIKTKVAEKTFEGFINEELADLILQFRMYIDGTVPKTPETSHIALNVINSDFKIDLDQSFEMVGLERFANPDVIEESKTAINQRHFFIEALVKVLMRSPEQLNEFVNYLLGPELSALIEA